MGQDLCHDFLLTCLCGCMIREKTHGFPWFPPRVWATVEVESTVFDTAMRRLESCRPGQALPAPLAC